MTTIDCPNCGTDIKVSFAELAGGRWWSWGLADYADAWEDDDPRCEAVVAAGGAADNEQGRR